jgi:hypothetical protein
MEDLGKCNLFLDNYINEVLDNQDKEWGQAYLIGLIKYLREEIEVSYRGFESFRLFNLKLKAVLFGEDYQERMTPEQLTDEKLLEAVRMLKEVY